MPALAPDRYDNFARALHWLMAVLVIGTLVLAETRTNFPRGSGARQLFGDMHYQIGVAVFMLAWIRLSWRLRSTEPAIHPPLPRWQRLSSHAVSRVFYALMIVLPVLGILARQAEGAPVSFLGLTLPTLMAVDRPLHRQLEQIHGWLGTAMIWLVVLHVVAALYHAFVRRDDALSRMLGGRRTARSG